MLEVLETVKQSNQLMSSERNKAQRSRLPVGGTYSIDLALVNSLFFVTFVCVVEFDKAVSR